MNGTCLEHITAGLVGFFVGSCDVCNGPTVLCAYLSCLQSNVLRTLNGLEKVNQVP